MPEEVSDEVKQAIQKFLARRSKFFTEEGHLNALRMSPRAGDTLVVTPPKCGTTWVQQIVHQLRSRGSMDFTEISHVVPWIELAHDCGQDINADQPWSPRCFKCHVWYQDCPKGNGSRHIIVLRNPLDAAASYYNFLAGWYFEPSEIPMETFIRMFWMKRNAPATPTEHAGYFHHVLAAWPHRHDESVLLLFYEDLKEDLAGSVDRIAKFMQIPDYDAALKQTVMEHASFQFMSTHSDQFDEKLGKQARNVAMGLPADAGMQNKKVNAGKVGGGKAALSPELAADIQTLWEELVGAPTGHMSYAQLRQQFHSERAEKAA